MDVVLENQGALENQGIEPVSCEFPAKAAPEKAGKLVPPVTCAITVMNHEQSGRRLSIV